MLGGNPRPLRQAVRRAGAQEEAEGMEIRVAVFYYRYDTENVI